MKNYILKSQHDVFEDHYEEGEGKNVNSYNLQSEITAKDPEQAVKLYVETVLYFTYFKNYIQLDEENRNIVISAVTVDVDNNEASKGEIELWKEGKMKLYNNTFSIEIFELTPIIYN